NLLIDFTIARLLLIEAVTQPVLRLPSDKTRNDVDIGSFRISHLQSVTLLDRPTLVAGLAPFVIHRAASLDDPRIIPGVAQGHRIKSAVRRDLGCLGRRRQRRKGDYSRQENEGPQPAPSHRPKTPPPYQPTIIASSARPLYAEIAPTRPDWRAQLLAVRAGGRSNRMCSSFSLSGGTGAGACIRRSCACWFIG